ncbi:lysophospholipid acyltransferase family protein [Aliiroseovarius sp. M344]|uniref:lysophospholipid acyltransferase family protein n=1 Tax=Aliiroseovarius sp. M344 TaxID=2867010 RepID=UPI0021AD6B6C|nr:lysophospholipid acyltransferase family protein [Aliiroseovarius sp. M344]UWQ14701.1 lysophospholipid acyltransferase family protein [Aliiroseovarius sp. M344]
MGQNLVNNTESDVVDGGQEPLSHDQYDRSSLSYANSLNNPLQSWIIRVLEWFTGKISILRMVRRLEKRGAPKGQAFWGACFEVMGIAIETPEEQLQNIPDDGPVIVVANHPHGLVDGMVLAELIGRRRNDYRILTRSVLDGLDEVASSYMIPVPFPHEPNAQQKMVVMRAQTMAHLKAGGLITLFPSGVVASSDTLLGPVIEREWNVFTAQLIRRSGAKVVPIFFPGANTRWYQMANYLSATLRQALLLHEIVKSCNRPQRPVIGKVLTDEQLDSVQTNPRGFMAWLRAHTLSLGDGK